MNSSKQIVKKYLLHRNIICESHGNLKLDFAIIISNNVAIIFKLDYFAIPFLISSFECSFLGRIFFEFKDNTIAAASEVVIFGTGTGI